MRQIYGDLVRLAAEGRFDLILHGCNCFCSMYAGIANQIRRAFPEAWEADQTTRVGDKNKLGSFSAAQVSRPGLRLIVLNCYVQYHYEGTGTLLDYEALALCMRAIKKRYGGKCMAVPKIGAGLAGGEWEKIRTIVTEELSGEDLTLVLKPSVRSSTRTAL